MQAAYRSIILFILTHILSCLVFSECPLQCKNGGQVDRKTCTCTCYGKWKGADCSGNKCNRPLHEKWLWTHSVEFFSNFAKSCMVSFLSQFDNKIWGFTGSFLSYKSLKLKLRVFLAGHIVAMVTYCAAKVTAPYLAMLWQGFDTMSLASTNI